MAKQKGDGEYTKNTLTNLQAAKLFNFVAPLIEPVSDDPKVCRYKPDESGKRPSEPEVAERASKALGFSVVATNISSLRKPEWGELAREVPPQPDLIDTQAVADLRQRIVSADLRIDALGQKLERETAKREQLEVLVREMRVEIDTLRMAMKFNQTTGVNPNYPPPAVMALNGEGK